MKPFSIGLQKGPNLRTEQRYPPRATSFVSLSQRPLSPPRPEGHVESWTLWWPRIDAGYASETSRFRHHPGSGWTRHWSIVHQRSLIVSIIIVQKLRCTFINHAIDFYVLLCPSIIFPFQSRPWGKCQWSSHPGANQFVANPFAVALRHGSDLLLSSGSSWGLVCSKAPPQSFGNRWQPVGGWGGWGGWSAPWAPKMGWGFR